MADQWWWTDEDEIAQARGTPNMRIGARLG